MQHKKKAPRKTTQIIFGMVANNIQSHNQKRLAEKSFAAVESALQARRAKKSTPAMKRDQKLGQKPKTLDTPPAQVPFELYSTPRVQIPDEHLAKPINTGTGSSSRPYPERPYPYKNFKLFMTRNI